MNYEKRITEIFKELDNPDVDIENATYLFYELLLLPEGENSKLDSKLYLDEPEDTLIKKSQFILTKENERVIEKMISFLNHQEPVYKIYATKILEKFNMFEKIPRSGHPFPGNLDNDSIKKILPYINQSVLNLAFSFWNYQEKDRLLENINEDIKSYIIKHEITTFSLDEKFDDKYLSNNLKRIEKMIKLLEKNGEIKIDNNIKFSNPQNSIYIDKVQRVYLSVPKEDKVAQDNRPNKELSSIPSYRYDNKLYLEYMIGISYLVNLEYKRTFYEINEPYGVQTLEDIIEHVPNKLIQAGLILYFCEFSDKKIEQTLNAIKNEYLVEYKKYLELMENIIHLYIPRIKEPDKKIINRILEKYNKPVKLKGKVKKILSEYESFRKNFLKNKTDVTAESLIKNYEFTQKLLKTKKFKNNNELGLRLYQILYRLRFFKNKKSINKLLSIYKDRSGIYHSLALDSLQFMLEFESIPKANKTFMDNFSDEDLKIIINHIELIDLNGVSFRWNYQQKDRILNLVDESDREIFFQYLNNHNHGDYSYDEASKRIQKIIDLLIKSGEIKKENKPKVIKNNKNSLYISMYKEKVKNIKENLKADSERFIKDEIEKSKLIPDFNIDKKQLTLVIKNILEFKSKNSLYATEEYIKKMPNEYIRSSIQETIYTFDFIRLKDELVQKSINTRKKIRSQEFENLLNMLSDMFLILLENNALYLPKKMRRYANIILQPENVYVDQD